MDARAAHAARLLADAQPLTRELVLGVLRWQLVLDTLLARHARLPLSGAEPEVRAVLRCGLFEAARLSTPVPVAVAEAVRVAKALAPRAAGFVNAVLRRAVAEAWPDAGDEATPLALRMSHPEWLVERWLALLGREAAREALASDQQPAPLTLLASVSDPEALAAAGCRLEAHPWASGVLVAREGAEAAVSAIKTGRAYAIDPTAVVVARLLPETSGLALDVAAAPGGKSLVLAGERRRCRHLACDRHLGRSLLMRDNFRLLDRAPSVVAAEGTQPPLRAGSCSAILLDAPCSGTGTLRRHPEIRWRLGPGDPAKLAALQRRLIEAGAELLAPGGWLLYSTCSLEPEENAGVVADLPLEALPLAGRLPSGVPFVELPTGGVVIPPTPLGDGFTVHLLRRASRGD